MSGKQRDSLYNVAKIEIRKHIGAYLKLIQETNNLAQINKNALSSIEALTILLAGKGSNLDPRQVTADQAIVEWERRLALPFDIETAITTGVYFKLREVAEIYFYELYYGTNSFQNSIRNLSKLIRNIYRYCSTLVVFLVKSNLKK